MKLVSLEVGGFRAFAGKHSFDLDGQAILLVGDNGTGKTSLFDAIYWALCGRVPRFDGDPNVISRWSETGEATVTLTLRRDSQQPLVITRTTDGRAQRVRFSAGEDYRDGSANDQILRTLWEDATLTEDPSRTFSVALERAVYLQQDRVRDFVEAVSDQDRFLAMSELLGVGRVAELQMQLERGRSAWTRATNVTTGDRDELAGRLSNAQARLATLPTEAPKIAAVRVEWDALLSRATRSGLGAFIGSNELSATTIDRLSRQADAQLGIETRRLDSLKQLSADLQAVTSLSPVPDIDLIRSAADAADSDVKRLQAAVTDAQRQLREVRRLKLESATQREELQTLAQLALRHLGERCPVCGQSYDHDLTMHRLTQLASGVSSTPEPEPEVTSQAIVELGNQLTTAETARVTRAAELIAAEAAIRDDASVRERIRQRAAELNVQPSDNAEQGIALLINQIQDQIESLRQIRSATEALAVSVASISEEARRREVLSDIDQTQRRLTDVDRELQRRRKTGETASRMIDALRESTSDLVARQLEELDPLVQRVYGRIDPHPVFKSLRLLSWMRGGRGRLSAEVADLVTEVRSANPAVILSSSQTNALAVAVFLSLNLGLPMRPIDAVLLDDPLQSLDDVNLLGLIDLLRRTMQRRQLVISTHDERFGQLLARKLRPVDRGQRTVIHRFFDWGRRGPNVTMTSIPPDVQRFRLVDQTA